LHGAGESGTNSDGMLFSSKSCRERLSISSNGHLFTMAESKVSISMLETLQCEGDAMEHCWLVGR
jgi:hypothetical protein